MNHGKIFVAGIGPGSEEDITPAVRTAIMQSDVVVGYKYYFNFIRSIVRPETECIDTGMKKEKDRAALAFEYAEQGHTVCVVSSGDAGIYGMAPLVLEMKREKGCDVEVEILPGISAFQKGAALLGAPIGHDFCIISLSDLMTPWEKIERRIEAAAAADFVTAVYNPKSEGRYWQLYRLKELFLKHRQPETPIGYIRQAGREEQQVNVTTLLDFNPEEIDMFTIVIIGNSQSYTWDDKIITPRGYYREQPSENVGIGQEIMMRSFRTIESELRDKNIPLVASGPCCTPSIPPRISTWRISSTPTTMPWKPSMPRYTTATSARSSPMSPWRHPVFARDPRTPRDRSEVLSRRSACSRNGIPSENHPHAGRYPPCRGRTPGSPLRFR